MRWGKACVDRLLGDFAFAIWDKLEQKLFIARDHLGLKPLYYYKTDRVIIFASEIKAIFSLTPCELNHNRIADYLIGSLEGYDKEITFYKGIKRLSPAHFNKYR